MPTPAIRIQDEANCYITNEAGVEINCGAPADVIVNMPEVAEAVSAALAAFSDSSE